MEANQPTSDKPASNHPASKNWNNVQTYSMAVICLILGTAMGYLLHAPATANAARRWPRPRPLLRPAMHRTPCRTQPT